MATPPTRVSYNTPSTGNYSSTATSRTTTSFDVTAGDVIVVLCSIENGTTPTSVTPSASGGSVTWTSRASQSPSANQSAAYCWTGAVGASATGITVSLNRPSSDASLWWGMSATVYRNHGGVGVAFSGNNGTASGAPSVSATCSANSAVVCQINDWNAASGASRVWRTINGSAQTETVYFTNATHHTVYGGYSPDTGAAGSITQGLTAPSTQRWVLAGVEILGTSGGSTLSLSSTGTGTSTGSLDVTIIPAPLSLSATGTGTSTGSLGLSVVNRVSSTGAGQTTGSVALTLSPGALSATGGGTTTGSAALSSTLALSASGTGQTTGSLDLTIQPAPLQLSATGTGTTTGSLDVTIVSGSTTHGLSATGAGTTGGSAALSMTAALSSTGVAATAGSAVLSEQLTIGATGTGATTGSAALRATLNLSGTGNGQTSGSLNITIATGVNLDLSATGTGTTTGSLSLIQVNSLSATGTSQSTGSVNLLRNGQLRALGLGNQTAGSLNLNLVSKIAASGFGQTSGSLEMRVSRHTLSATGYTVSKGSLEVTSPTISFTPPQHEEPFRVNSQGPFRALAYHRLTYASSIVRVGGTFVSIRTPSAEQLAGLVEGVDFFRGGYEYEIDLRTAAELELAGYNIPHPGYGLGLYGAGPYGD